LVQKIKISESLRAILTAINVPDAQFISAVHSSRTDKKIQISTLESWLRIDDPPGVQSGSIDKLVEYFNGYADKPTTENGLGLSGKVLENLNKLDKYWFSKTPEEISNIFEVDRIARELCGNEPVILPDKYEIWPGNTHNDIFGELQGSYYLLRTLRPGKGGIINRISCERLELYQQGGGLKCKHINSRHKDYSGCVFVSPRNIFITMFRQLVHKGGFSHRDIIARYDRGTSHDILGCLLSRVTMRDEDPASYVCVLVSENKVEVTEKMGFKATIAPGELSELFLDNLNGQISREYFQEKEKRGAIPAMSLVKPGDIVKLWEGFDFTKFLNECRIKDAHKYSETE